jgi:hypothetical protein
MLINSIARARSAEYRNFTPSYSLSFPEGAAEQFQEEKFPIKPQKQNLFI